MSDPLPSAPIGPSVRRWYGVPWLLLVLGLLSVALLVGTQLFRERLIDPDVSRVVGLHEILTHLTIAHLWVEEFVTGDEVAMEPVWRSLDDAETAIAQLLGHGAVARGALPPLSEPSLVLQAERIRALVEQFEDMSKDRHEGYEVGKPVGIGSQVDVEYDRVFGEVVRETESLEVALSARMARSYSRSRLLFQLILLAWVTLIALGFAALWSRERRRARAEEALRTSQEQLLQAQKMHAIGRLAGGMAHDINNYLGAMTSQCEVVRLQVGPDHPTSAKMEAVIATAFKASGLIRRLLAFSRQQPTLPEVVDLNQVIADLDRMMQRLLGEDIEISFRLAADLWPVEVDISQLEQVIVNLLVNARDAMPGGARSPLGPATARQRSSPAISPRGRSARMRC